MIPKTRFLLLLLIGAFLAMSLPTEVIAQERRVNRLREHERKIRQIIEERRQERAEQQENAEDQEEGEEEATSDEERENRAASSVVLGLRFLTEEGVSDYNMIVTEEETFVTEVMMFNIDQNDIDRVRLAISYDKRFIEPVRIFDTTLRSFVDGDPKFRLDEREAVIAYDAKLDEPLRIPETALLRILWRAVRPTSYTGIDFRFSMTQADNEYHTAMYVRGNNILGVADDPADGVISGGLMIEEKPSPTGERVLQGKAEELRELHLGSVASDLEVGIELEGPRQPVQVGRDFPVHVRLNNPDGALIDSVSFFIKYDPEVLQVVDQDRFNWIRRGINVHDGPYQGNFPWDMHRNNLARNDRGIITYQKGLSNGAALPSERMATIRFRPIQPTLQTHIYFIPGRPRDIYHTSVRYFGYERLNLGPELSKPIHTLEVLPAPEEPEEGAPRTRLEYVGAGAIEERQEELPAVRSLRIERN